jgi:aminoglycoside phosphotransferase (APT) family kinase protein
MPEPVGLQELNERLSAYIEFKSPEEGKAIIGGLQRLPGGSSREMYRFHLRRQSTGGEESTARALILRKDPPGQGLVAASERRAEFGVIRALRGTDVPVPDVFWLEEDAAHLGAPFFVLAEITGCETNGALFSKLPYSAVRNSIAESKWSILGKLARLDPETLGLTSLLPVTAPEECWQRELAFWETMVENNRLGPQPITSATIRYLRRHPPPPPHRLSIVHGDYRTGNFLFGSDGKVHGVLDWEMAHLGDPLEDLAYSLSRQWALGDMTLRGNLAPLEIAIAQWERASGMVVDQEALRWWRLFSTVKCQGLWASGAAGWRSGLTPDMVMVMAAWSCGATHEREALELMDHL